MIVYSNNMPLPDLAWYKLHPFVQKAFWGKEEKANQDASELEFQLMCLLSALDWEQSIVKISAETETINNCIS